MKRNELRRVATVPAKELFIELADNPKYKLEHYIEFYKTENDALYYKTTTAKRVRKADDDISDRYTRWLCENGFKYFD